jgi:hypothetical protein
MLGGDYTRQNLSEYLKVRIALIEKYPILVKVFLKNLC